MEANLESLVKICPIFKSEITLTVLDMKWKMLYEITGILCSPWKVRRLDNMITGMPVIYQNLLSFFYIFFTSLYIVQSMYKNIETV